MSQVRKTYALSRRNKACVFHTLIYVILSWNLSFLQKYSGTRIIATKFPWNRLTSEHPEYRLCLWKCLPPILCPFHCTCGMSHLYVWCGSLICVTWLIHMCDVAHSYVWHDWIICVTWLVHSRYPYKNLGWRRLIGSPKLQIIFLKRATKYRSLLRKWLVKIRDPMSLRHPAPMQTFYTCKAGIHVHIRHAVYIQVCQLCYTCMHIHVC